MFLRSIYSSCVPFCFCCSYAALVTCFCCEIFYIWSFKYYVIMSWCLVVDIRNTEMEAYTKLNEWSLTYSQKLLQSETNWEFAWSLAWQIKRHFQKEETTGGVWNPKNGEKQMRAPVQACAHTHTEKKPNQNTRT